MSEIDEDILYAKKCPYCQSKTKLVDSKIVYKNKSYGWIWHCVSCSAYVGCHRGTKKPLGRLANESLRSKKRAAHRYFDNMWRRKPGSRKRAYSWLAEKMGLEEKYTHIGMFDIEQCEEVVRLCRPYFKKRGSNNG